MPCTGDGASTGSSASGDASVSKVEASQEELTREQEVLPEHDIAFQSQSSERSDILMWVQFGLGCALIIGLAVLYAVNTVAARRIEEPKSPIARYLDHMGFHHIGLVSRNLSQSMSFYIDILGGKAVSIGPEPMAISTAVGLGLVQSSGKLPSELEWGAVSFGDTMVVLWEAVSSMASPVTRPQLAFRLAHTSNVTEFMGVLRERLASFEEFADLQCEDNSLLAPDWQIISCQGPDGEAIQFWQPSLSLALALEKKRKVWAPVPKGESRDSRVYDGPDLFE